MQGQKQKRDSNSPNDTLAGYSYCRQGQDSRSAGCKAEEEEGKKVCLLVGRVVEEKVRRSRAEWVWVGLFRSERGSGAVGVLWVVRADGQKKWRANQAP